MNTIYHPGEHLFRHRHEKQRNLAWSTAGHTIDTDVVPTASGSFDLGSRNLPFANGYFDTVNIGDVGLSEYESTGYYQTSSGKGFVINNANPYAFVYGDPANQVGVLFNTNDSSIDYNYLGAPFFKVNVLGGTTIYGSLTLEGLFSSLGDTIYGGSSKECVVLTIGSSNTVLKSDGSTPSWGAVTEDDIYLSNVTTNNASNASHGFCPILPNTSALFLNGQGNWATPSGTVNSYVAQSYDGTDTINVVHNLHVPPIVQAVDNGTGEVLDPTSITHNSNDDFTVVLSAPGTGIVIATVGSPQAGSVKIVTGDYVIDSGDMTIQCSAAGSTLTLLDATAYTGREFRIDNSSDGNIFLTSASGYIQKQLTQTIPMDSCLTTYSDGSDWRIY